MRNLRRRRLMNESEGRISRRRRLMNENFEKEEFSGRSKIFENKHSRDVTNEEMMIFEKYFAEESHSNLLNGKFVPLLQMFEDFRDTVKDVCEKTAGRNTRGFVKAFVKADEAFKEIEDFINTL